MSVSKINFNDRQERFISWLNRSVKSTEVISKLIWIWTARPSCHASLKMIKRLRCIINTETAGH